MAPSLRSRGLAATFLLALTQAPSVFGQVLTAEGCYSSAPELTYAETFQYQSSSHCQGVCLAKSMPVLGITNGGDCYCGQLLPSESAATLSTACNVPCQGYGQETCGSIAGAFNIWLTGFSSNVGTSDGSSSAAASSNVAVSTAASSTAAAARSSGQAKTTAAAVAASSSSAPPSVVTVGSTVVRTVPGQSATATSAPDGSSSSGSGGSKVGVAVGVVVGIIAVIGIIGGIVYFLKKRKSVASVDRHRRNTSVNAFASAASPPAYSSSDGRLDQSMAERRQSNGSIFADNEDYSRRILKVTNPDRQ